MPNIKSLVSRWKEIILITASIRVALIIITAIISPRSNFLGGWVQWDGPHYLDLAKNWYQVQEQQSLWIVFYPLYPLLIKILNFLINDFAVSSLVISILFSFSASILLFELTLLDYQKKVAILAVWFLNIFPTAYFLQASYTESLFLTWALATVYFFRKGQFGLAGLAGLLSTATRINGLTLLPVLLFEARSTKTLITIFLIPLGFLSYLLINFLIFGNPLYFFQPLSSYWHKSFTWPWIGITESFNNLWYYQNELLFTYIFEFLAIVFILMLGIFCYFKVRKSYAYYILINLFLLTSTNFILSTPRYTLILFPVFIILGMIKNRIVIITLSLIFLPLLIYFATLYTQGKWAF